MLKHICPWLGVTILILAACTISGSAVTFTRLTFRPTIHDYMPAWSPDGSKIAFYSDSLPKGIWVMPASGGAATYLFSGANPCWSPDGTQIAFAYDGEIWIAPAGGGAPTQVTFMKPTRWQREPAWSPDGSTISFTSQDYTNIDGIWKIPASGGVPVMLYGLYGHSSCWSPDGRRIAFAEGILNGSHIVHMAPDGSDVQHVTNGNVFDFSPSWSPDGRWIAFSSTRSNRANSIWIVSASGGVPIQITDTAYPLSESDPKWSPDSRKIVFTADWWTPTGDKELWMASDLFGGTAVEETTWGKIKSMFR